MPQGNFNYFIIVIVVVLGLMIILQTRNAKKQQNTIQQFRDSLEPGTEVITIGGIIGKVVSVDTQYEEIVIDSEGSLLRFTFKAVNKAYVRPAFIDDEPEEDVKVNNDEIETTTSEDVNTDESSPMTSSEQSTEEPFQTH